MSHKTLLKIYVKLYVHLLVDKLEVILQKHTMLQ